jgi:hypothetical protein
LSESVILAPEAIVGEDKQAQLQQMDKDAAAAREELERQLNAWQAKDVALWWKRWYMKAGHKRLGRVLVDLSRKFEGG